MIFKAYTYYLYHRPTNQKYYGSRWANKCDPEQDLWSTYFSSSVDIEVLIAEYGKDSFDVEVRKTFDTAQEAFDWEQRVLRKLDVINRTDWINKSFWKGHLIVPNTPEINKKKGRPGVKKAESFGLMVAESNRRRGPRAESTKIKIRDKVTGVNNFNYGRFWVRNLELGIEEMCFDLSVYPEGWSRGRLPQTEDSNRKRSETLKLQHRVPWNSGLVLPESHRKLLRKPKGPQTEEHKRKRGLARKKAWELWRTENPR